MLFALPIISLDIGIKAHAIIFLWNLLLSVSRVTSCTRMCISICFMFLISRVLLICICPNQGNWHFSCRDNMFQYFVVLILQYIYIHTASGQFIIALVKENDRESCVPLWLSEWLYCLCNIYSLPRYKFLYDMQSVLPTCFTGKIFYFDFAKLWCYHLLLEACA